ncbi:Laminin G domain [Popillia japonica]|uniref:Laminin G domain n=1 Tax=Popillia japonica TaxID=7064 RepID=A0AAW1N9R9_POPJA
MQPSGNLMYAAGKVDYNILEIVNGAVQYRFELGSGEGVVRVSTIYVSDGKWHEIRLERDHNSARLIIDGVHTAQGSAPGISDILNLQSDEMYLGAEVHQHPSILGFEDIQRGFSGCMDDVRIARTSVPLHKSGDNSMAVLKRFANVEFSCDNNALVPPGACGSQPCMNGGTCKELPGGFECLCHARFQGKVCELDTDPCASTPCLYGGKCSPTIGGDYSCECMYRLSGKRCEYGKYCSPNPCKHGGVCEEGDEGPLCKCRFFTGDICEFDVNECESSPCQNGGTCINELGSFRCVCPPNTTGPYCGNSLYPSPIISSTFALTVEELIGILVGVMVLVILVLMYIFDGRRINWNINQIVLNSTRPHELAEYKRGSKLSNLEVNQRDIPVRSTRPSSYTATSQNENVLHYNSILNNLDSIRSYGSAGDELENVPRDYVRNLNLNNQTGGIGNNCESDKTAWADQMHLAQSFTEKPKIKNGYHWDCSDWARHSQTLPNITEVPGSEIPDSSSFHSNESNESRCHHLPPQMLGQINPDRDIETLNEDLESEFMADSECDQHAASPSLNALDSGNEEFRFTTADTYVRHPNSYLPTHGYNIPSEAEGECLHSPGADSDDVEPYGFPSNRNRRKNCDDDIGSVITTLEERNSLLGGGYGSNSDMSTNLCEIEDSECETEQKPLNYLSGVQQTSV